MIYLYSFTGLAFIVSLIVSREKTIKSLKIAWKKFLKIIPSFMMMLVFVSIILYLLPDEVIAKLLGMDSIIKSTNDVRIAFVPLTRCYFFDQGHRVKNIRNHCSVKAFVKFGWAAF